MPKSPGTQRNQSGSGVGGERLVPLFLPRECANGAPERYLVDPASSHMLVSKIKPCMCKYKLVPNSETANGSLNQLWSLRSFTYWIPVVILELIHALKLRSLGRRALLLDQDQCVGFGRTALW